MTIRVAINGYGRIGRNILRAHYEGGKFKNEIQIVAINDLGNAESNAHLTRYDTAHGKFPGTVTVDGDTMIVNGDKIKVFAERNPANIPCPRGNERRARAPLRTRRLPSRWRAARASSLRGASLRSLYFP